MKKGIFTILLVLLFAGVAAAGETVLVPKTCEKVNYAEYSTGGGKRAIVYIKILCEDKKGNTTLYMAKKLSAGGMLGMGRWTIPDKIDIRKANVSKAQWD